LRRVTDVKSRKRARGGVRRAYNIT